MVDAIAPLTLDDPAPPARAVAPAAPGFADRVADEVQSLNRQLVAAETAVRDLAAGGASNLHDVMITLEQARLALQLATQVRTRVVEAYQELMRMQV